LGKLVRDRDIESAVPNEVADDDGAGMTAGRKLDWRLERSVAIAVQDSHRVGSELPGAAVARPGRVMVGIRDDEVELAVAVEVCGGNAEGSFAQCTSSAPLQERCLGLRRRGGHRK